MEQPTFLIEMAATVANTLGDALRMRVGMGWRWAGGGCSGVRESFLRIPGEGKRRWLEESPHGCWRRGMSGPGVREAMRRTRWGESGPGLGKP
jgi:hypothetical protein